MSADILFSQTFEDPCIDSQALKVEPGQRVFAITSGGCTPLSLLLHEPASVLSIDNNPAQTHMARLKVEAIRRLATPALHAFLGVTPAKDRVATYQRLAADLPEDTRKFWEIRTADLELGIIHCGVLDRFLARVGAVLRRFSYDEPTMERFFSQPTPEAQSKFFDEVIDGGLGRMVGDLFFRWVLRPGVLRFLLPKEFTGYVTDPAIGPGVRSRLEHVLRSIPLATNYFLWPIYRGRYPTQPEALPPYLHPANLERLRGLLPRLEMRTAPIEEVLPGLADQSVDRFQLSNVFEWIPETRLVALFKDMHRVARPGARFFFRNFLVKRELPKDVEDLYHLEPGEGERLRLQDRSFIYSAMYVLQHRPASAPAGAGRDRGLAAGQVSGDRPRPGPGPRAEP